MVFYKDIERRKDIVRNYIRIHPKATFREIKEKTYCKINKVYTGGIREAFEDAGIKPPRTFYRKTKDEKMQIIISYIKKNPTTGGHNIARDTKINPGSVFDNMEEAFSKAGVKYPRGKFRNLYNRKKEERIKQVIDLIRTNPIVSIEEIIKVTHIHPYRIFKNIKEMYKYANIDYIRKGKKRSDKKCESVIDFIKKNNFATQREINKSCRTKVQEIFEDGIFEAYKEAGIEFPYQRVKLHGVVFKNIRDDAEDFEKEIALKLTGYGNVNRLVRTKRGIADVILERKGKRAVIEIKNYKIHEISISQIKQLNKYLEDTNCDLGFLICLRRPKRDRFLIGNNKIFVLEDKELNKIPKLMDPYFNG